jgi:DNA-binding beta-propeller fold protein YncE
MNGKQIWRFQDTSLLRSPQGVVVDNQGFVFVAGEKSRNIVVISPDGNSAKEAYQISSPRGMCYNKSENEILVCHTDRKASWFQNLFTIHVTTGYGSCIRCVKLFISVT